MGVIKLTGFNTDQKEALNNKYLLANGYLGVSGLLEEFENNDFAHVKLSDNLVQKDESRYYLSVFNPLYTTVSVKGIILHPDNIIPTSHVQSLNLDNGLFKRTTVYTVEGVDITIHSERFLDQKNRNFIVSKYVCFTSGNIDIEINHGIDLEIDHLFKSDIMVDNISNSSEIILEGRILSSNKPLNMIYSFEKNFKHRNNNKKIKNQESYVIKAESKREYEIIKYIAIASEEKRTIDYLLRHIKKSRSLGYQKLLEDNNAFWEKLWRNSRVEIFNNPLVDRYSQFNQFQLINNRPVTETCYCSRYGLTNKEIVHSFTLEMYRFQYYLNTDYKSARRILLSKIRYLNEAKQNAEKIKKPGALYTDNEFNLYINALTVVNFVDYIERTADRSLLALGGLEMLLEISKFYLSIIKPNAKKTNYQVLNVTNLNGSIKNIDNSALLNYLIKDCLGKTANMVALAKTENRKEVEEYLKANDYDKQIDKMREVRRKLYQQSPNVNNLVQYYDNYFKEEREIDNPDLLILFMLYPHDFKELVKKENYVYYSKFVNPDPLGKINLAFIACSKGYEKESNKYFKHVLGLNLLDDANKLNYEQTYLDLGVASALNLYLVYGLAGLKHDRYLLMADSFIPNDIRRLEFKINIANNIGSIKIKRNSATVEWQ